MQWLMAPGLGVGLKLIPELSSIAEIVDYLDETTPRATELTDSAIEVSTATEQDDDSVKSCTELLARKLFSCCHKDSGEGCFSCTCCTCSPCCTDDAEGAGGAVLSAKQHENWSVLGQAKMNCQQIRMSLFLTYSSRHDSSEHEMSRIDFLRFCKDSKISECKDLPATVLTEFFDQAVFELPEHCGPDFVAGF